MEVKIYDYQKKEYYYENPGKIIIFLYNTYFGRMLLKFIITKIWFTKLTGTIIKSKLSKFKIKSFIKNNNIDISQYIDKKYISFDDFFIRKIKEEKREFNNQEKDLISACDAKLCASQIDENLCLKVKNSKYTISELLQDDTLAQEYAKGTCLVFRLTKDDYHHYYNFDDGKVLKSKKINGILHTVMPISSKKYKAYSENYREYDILKTTNFDKVIYMEVGALMIGKINNDDKKTFKRHDHKGYFSFGASTIILLFKENQIKINEDIIKENEKGIEVRVKLGSIIGHKVVDSTTCKC